MRLFPDAAGNLNRSAAELGLACAGYQPVHALRGHEQGASALVSCNAAPPELANELVDRVVERLRSGRGRGGDRPFRGHDAGQLG